MSSHFRFVPRPITDRVYWEHVRTGAAFAAWREANEAVVQRTERIPPLTLASDYLLTRRNNDRSQLDRINFQHRGALAALALRRVMLGLDLNDRDDRLLDWLWAVATDASWSLANHKSRGDLPEMSNREYSLDLNSCEMAAFFAEFIEILRPWADAQSDTLSESILALVDDRILTPFAEGEPVWWESRINNWIGVCAGSILAACESFAVLGRPRPEARARALRDLRIYLDESFTKPNAESDEGVGYWSYGWSGAACGLSRLTEQELAATVDMDRFRAVADYPRRGHLFGNDFFAGNDTPARVLPWRAFVPWMAAAAGDEWLARWMAASTELPKPDRLLNTVLRTLDAIGREAAQPPNPGLGRVNTSVDPVRILEDQAVVIFRAPTSAGEILATFTGGHNDERHNHNDLGEFQIALGERMIVPDIGAPSPYPADFFGPNRYKYLGASSRGHSCPLIGGHEQREGVDSAAKIISWQSEGECPHFKLDLTSAYPPESGLSRWTRELACERFAGVMRLTDEYEMQRPQSVTHVIWSIERPVREAVAGNDADLCRFALGTALVCEVSPTPASWEIEEILADDHALKNFAGQTLLRLAISYAPAVRRQVVTRFFARADAG